MTDVELRPIDLAELPGFYRALAETFGEDPRDDDREHFARTFEADRSIAAFDGGEVVATAGAYSLEMTLPARTRWRCTSRSGGMRSASWPGRTSGGTGSCGTPSTSAAAPPRGGTPSTPSRTAR